MERVVRSRKYGWRKPPNTIFVGRPNKFSNPFRIIKGKIYADASHRTGTGNNPLVFIEEVAPELIRARCVELYRMWVNYENPYDIIPCPFTPQDVVDELDGHNIACWCQLTDQEGNPVPCHVDVLFEIIRDNS